MSGVGAAASPTAVRRLRERNRLGTADIRHGRLRVELVELVHAVPPCISCRRALPRAATTARYRRWAGSHRPHAPVRRASPDPTRPTGPSDLSGALQRDCHPPATTRWVIVRS